MPPLFTYTVLFKYSNMNASIEAYDLKHANEIAEKYFQSYEAIFTK